MTGIVRSSASKVALFYFLCAAAWVVVSDWLVGQWHPGLTAPLLGVQMAKGLLFVIAMTAALYVLVRRLHRAEERSRQMEEMLRESKRLEAVGSLAATMVHDLNNMLAIIRGFTDLARLEQGRGGAVASQRLGDIDSAVTRANGLVRQLSTFIQRQPAPREVLNPAAVVQEFEPILRHALSRGNGMRIDLAADLPDLPLDRSGFEQALLNLVMNARDAMQDRPVRELRIEARCVGLQRHVSLHQPQPTSGEFVRIRVADTGGGIPAANIIAIFSPFFSTKPTGKGTGLGLASVLRTAQQHGGWVEVESEIGQGSCFDWYLPVPNKPVAVAA